MKINISIDLMIILTEQFKIFDFNPLEIKTDVFIKI